jgi:shikimate kinase/3-dehydroquinate synthase
VPRARTGNQTNGPPPEVEVGSQSANELLVGGAVDGRRGDGDLEDPRFYPEDRALSRPRFHPHLEQDAAGVRLQWRSHALSLTPALRRRCRNRRRLADRAAFVQASPAMRRPLLISGFMATGKSSVGKRVAELSGRRFVDLDREIERKGGASVAELFSELGESGFRALERSALFEALDATGSAPVIALGGGALVSREVRLAAVDRAVVVTLTAGLGEILDRARAESGTRPLLAGDPAARAAALLELRQTAYAEAHARLATDGRSVQEIAQQALGVWQRDPIAVAAGERSYAVDIGEALVAERLPAAVGKASKRVLISDETVYGLHGAAVRDSLGDPAVVLLSPGEQHKHIGSVEKIWRAAQAAEVDRKACFVALGGGVVSDIAGFAAASYQRGVRWVGIPTTLLAMVDASVGGKTGVDLGSAKNAVGAFHQPSAVLCDVTLLSTESDRGFRSALAEVVKTALIGDPELFELLERETERVLARSNQVLAELVRCSIRVKARIVSADERESGLRAVLNLGHTVGHALESQGGYSRLSHGEAVSLGLVAALRIGVALAATPRELAERTERLLAKLGLPADIAREPLVDAVGLIGHDKKRAGKSIKFVVAQGLGDVVTRDIELGELRRHTLALAGS